MAKQLILTSEIPSALAAILRTPSQTSTVIEVVARCHRMAVAYLRVKMASRSFDPGRLGLSVEDFAYDAIAELFRRDENDRFVVLERAFEALQPIERRAPDLVEQELRRQVFNAVMRQVYRSYRDTDPVLAKIVRNIKHTLGNHATAQLLDIRGDWMIVPRTSCPLLEHRPVMAPELLAPDLHARIAPHTPLREMLAVVVTILCEQAEYSRMFPMVGFALLVRGIYSLSALEEEAGEEGEGLTEDDLDRLLHPALRQVMVRAKKYVARGRVSEQNLAAYRQTLREIFVEEVAGGPGEDTSFYETLAKYDPQVTRDEYLEKHRLILEYLVKLVRKELQKILRREWKSLREG